MNDLQPLNQNWLFGFVRQNASRVNTQVGTTRSASGRSASPNIAGNGHTPTGKTSASANRANGDDLDACILCMERFVGTALYRDILRE